MELDTVVQGDCIEVMAGMPDECVDLVVTSPPYDNLSRHNSSLILALDMFNQ